MKFRQFLVLALSCLAFHLTTAQDVAPFQMADEHAKEINTSVLEMLYATTWQCQDRLIMEGDSYWNRTTPFALTISKDNSFEMLDGNRSYTGTWELVGNDVLQFNVPEEKQKELKGMVQGGYAIYKVSDDKLTLSKVLTSADDKAQIFRFLSDDFNDYVQSKIRNPRPASERPAPRTYTEDEQKQSIIQRISALQSTKTVSELEKMTLQELRVIYDSL